MENNSSAPMPATTKSDKHAKAGFILGLVSIIAWFIPLTGFPVTICAIVFSSLGLKSLMRHKKAVAGLILGIVFLVLTILNSIAGAIVAFNEYSTSESAQTDTTSAPSSVDANVGVTAQ